jgi:hypothetical protein
VAGDRREGTPFRLAPMPGIMITRGAALRIPAGGLRIPLDGSPPPPVETELLLDIWDRWLAIAGSETSRAEVAHKRLLESIDGTDQERGDALEAEFNAALLAVAATAFAIDAFYSSVKERVPPHPDEELWAKNRTAREKRVVEVFKLAFMLKGDRATLVLGFLKRLFRLRGEAVHPPSKFQPPILHEDLGVGVEWRLVTYTAKTARAVLDSTGNVFRHVLDNPKPEHTELAEWVPSAKALLGDAFADAGSR